MNIEEAIDILKNSVADYVIGEYCEKCADNKICDDRNEDCYYQQAIDIVIIAYEKEKEKNKKIENELKDITKKYMEAESVKFWYNYIHKDKIRKMLQELEGRRNKQPVIGYWSKKAMLEKLLKEE